MSDRGHSTPRFSQFSKFKTSFTCTSRSPSNNIRIFRIPGIMDNFQHIFCPFMKNHRQPFFFAPPASCAPESRPKSSTQPEYLYNRLEVRNYPQLVISFILFSFATRAKLLLILAVALSNAFPTCTRAQPIRFPLQFPEDRSFLYLLFFPAANTVHYMTMVFIRPKVRLKLSSAARARSSSHTRVAAFTPRSRVQINFKIASDTRVPFRLPFGKINLCGQRVRAYAAWVFSHPFLSWNACQLTRLRLDFHFDSNW